MCDLGEDIEIEEEQNDGVCDGGSTKCLECGHTTSDRKSLWRYEYDGEVHFDEVSLIYGFIEDVDVSAWDLEPLIKRYVPDVDDILKKNEFSEKLVRVITALDEGTEACPKCKSVRIFPMKIIEEMRM